MAEQWSAGFRVVQILWNVDRVPEHALDLPDFLEVDPDCVIFHHETPLSRSEAFEAVAELNQETMDTWMGRSWHAVFEVQEPEECWGQIYETEEGFEEDWTFFRKASIAIPTAEEISYLCATS